MKKQIDFQECENTRLDEKIRKTMKRDFPLPENVDLAKNKAFEEIRNRQAKQETANQAAAKVRAKKHRRNKFWGSAAGLVAAAAAFSGVCITNPAFAAQVPLVGHVFEEIGQSLGFGGDFSEYATPLAENTEGDVQESGETDAVAEAAGESTQAEGSDAAGDNADAAGESDGTENVSAENGDSLYTQTKDGVTVTLSEVYCNDAALYISMVIKTEEKFPETLIMYGSDAPVINLMRSTLKFSFNSQEQLYGECLDGRMVDEYTYAGVLRYDLFNFKESTDYDAWYEAYDEFLAANGLDGDNTEQLKEFYGVDMLTDADIVAAGGPDIKDYQEQNQIPEKFTVDLSIPQVVGSKPDGKFPEMPEDIYAEYEKAMKENGLGLSDEEYENFTEEQMEIERQLRTKMHNQYGERYPETQQDPNAYMNWWFDGPWDFTFEVTKDSSQSIVKEINDVDENGLGLISVTKTPFELTVENDRGGDYVTVVLDADGNLMEGGTFGGYSNVLSLSGRDTSKVDIYMCDYLEYMDELKGYYWSEDYEENKKTKTFKQLLDERALYHKEITFEE